MADEERAPEEQPEEPAAEAAAPEEPVAPPRQQRKPKKPEGQGFRLSDEDVTRIAGSLKEQVIEGFREAGAFDAPVEPVAPPSQPTVPPAPTDVAPADGTAPPAATPAPPQRRSIAQRLMGSV